MDRSGVPIAGRAARADAGAVTAIAPGALFVLLWSSGYVVGAVGVGAAGPFALLSLRFVLAALVAVPLALRVPG